MPGHCTIDLLRHGDTGVNGFCGSLDVPLSERGWQQMHNATQVDFSWQAIISSPLCRCAEYAKAFAKQNHLPLVLDARLRELDFGEWEGQRVEQLMLENADGLTQFWMDPWNYTPPDGECLLDFEQRVQTAWKYICDYCSGQRILLVTHGGVIRMLLYLTGQLPRAELLSIDVPHASLHTLNPAEADLVCSSGHC